MEFNNKDYELEIKKNYRLIAKSTANNKQEVINGMKNLKLIYLLKENKNDLRKTLILISTKIIEEMNNLNYAFDINLFKECVNTISFIYNNIEDKDMLCNKFIEPMFELINKIKDKTSFIECLENFGNIACGSSDYNEKVVAFFLEKKNEFDKSIKDISITKIQTTESKKNKKEGNSSIKETKHKEIVSKKVTEEEVKEAFETFKNSNSQKECNEAIGTIINYIKSQIIKFAKNENDIKGDPFGLSFAIIKEMANSSSDNKLNINLLKECSYVVTLFCTYFRIVEQPLKDLINGIFCLIEKNCDNEEFVNGCFEILDSISNNEKVKTCDFYKQFIEDFNCCKKKYMGQHIREEYKENKIEEKIKEEKDNGNKTKDNCLNIKHKEIKETIEGLKDTSNSEKWEEAFNKFINLSSDKITEFFGDEKVSFEDKWLLYSKFSEICIPNSIDDGLMEYIKMTLSGQEINESISKDSYISRRF